MNKHGRRISLLILFLIMPLKAQVIYETGDNLIYDFLYRLNQQKIIDINETISPLSKNSITSYLNEIDTKKAQLTDLQTKELDWYMKRYSLESGSEASILGELNLIEDNFKLRLLPILGYGISSTGDKSGFTRKVGAHLDAYISDNLGIMFEYLDSGEFGDNVDKRN